MFDGSMEIVSEYKEWIDALYRGKRLRPSAMSDVHKDMVALLNKSGLSVNEIVVLFSGIARSYCNDSFDANGVARLFADEIHRMIGDEDYDEDGELVDRTDAGGE